MINLLIGPPGGGKSYEAVAFHVLPALQKGRKVITNLPLNIEQFALLDPDYPALIEIRAETKAKPPVSGQGQGGYRSVFRSLAQERFNRAAFAHAEDYGDDWRHPETGAGPLYVIDECHIPLPRRGTPEDVEIWYSLHRHETADVLLITQSYGKINQAIRDLVQICYRVKKATALGSQGRYIRKVQDGVRGEVVNENIRKYEARYFPLYQSHTKGGGSELQASDIRPFWKHWSVIGAAIFLIVGFIMLAGAFSDGVVNSDPVSKPEEIKPIQKAAHAVQSVPEIKQAIVSPESKKDEKSDPLGGPYDPLALHVLGRISNAKEYVYLVMSSINGQPLKTFPHTELVKAGYKVEPVSDYVFRLTYKEKSRYVLADAPQVTVEQSASPGQSSAGGNPRPARGVPADDPPGNI